MRDEVMKSISITNSLVNLLFSSKLGHYTSPGSKMSTIGKWSGVKNNY